MKILLEKAGKERDLILKLRDSLNFYLLFAQKEETETFSQGKRRTKPRGCSKALSIDHSIRHMPQEKRDLVQRLYDAHNFYLLFST